MPVYEYECLNCAERFEVRRGFDDSSSVSCPRCKCEARRIFSPVPIIFKGSGFYVTDNRDKRNGGAESSTEKSTGLSKPGEKTS